MTYLVYIFAITLLVGPIITTAVYSKVEYHKSLSDNFQNWKLFKAIGIILFLAVSACLLHPANIGRYINKFWFFFLEPGMSIALIVYSKPASELLEGMSSLLSIGEDLAFIIGWFGLLAVSFWLMVDMYGA